jgi:demethylmenaquinone methyltransferase/2-methoxy-6-polyprenyl-1,4-benzoquinol methylase
MAFPLNEFYSRIYKRYDLINRLFTLGMDQRWRNFAVKKCLEQKPRKVLDLCCGTGDMTILLYTKGEENIQITGFDRNSHMLEGARQKSVRKNCRNIRFVQGDVSQLPFIDESFDCITIGFGFRNLTYNNPKGARHISEIFRVLKKGGGLFILESGVPENRLIQIFFRWYLFVVLVPLGFLVSGDLKAYRYLAQSSAGFFPVNEINRMLMEKGFVFCLQKKFFLGAANLIVARRT